MIEASAIVDPRDLDKLDRAISLMVKNTNRTNDQAVMRASITFLQSARAGTPRAKGLNRKQRVYGGNRYYVIHSQSDRPPRRVLIPSATRGTAAQRAESRKRREEVQKRYKRKPRVGAAKASWGRAFSDLNKSAGAVSAKLKRSSRLSRAKKGGNAFAPHVNITNDMSYILKIAPNLDSIALANAGKKLLALVEKGIEKNARRWR